MNLPGIGPYTAGAIMSIAYNQEFPLVDGNVERVFARFFNIEQSIRERGAKSFIWKQAKELIPPDKARWFNQALMELGAVICTPKNPGCLRCPIRDTCQSLLLGCVEQRPVIPPPKKVIPIEVVIGVLTRNGRYLIQQRPLTGLMAGLWEFPGGQPSVD
jgi:A/G-specific adenine glycosylase